MRVDLYRTARYCFIHFEGLCNALLHNNNNTRNIAFANTPFIVQCSIKKYIAIIILHFARYYYLYYLLHPGARGPRSFEVYFWQVFVVFFLPSPPLACIFGMSRLYFVFHLHLYPACISLYSWLVSRCIPVSSHFLQQIDCIPLYPRIRPLYPQLYPYVSNCI